MALVATNARFLSDAVNVALEKFARDAIIGIPNVITPHDSTETEELTSLSTRAATQQSLVN